MNFKTPVSSFFTVTICIYLAFVLSACGSSNKSGTDFLYFQNGANIVMAQQKETVIRINDLLSIQVYSKTTNQVQTEIFNIPASILTPGYQVNEAGNIEMPVLGSIKAVGLTKGQLQTLLVQKLTNYVKDPSVVVRFLQFNVNVLGEVRAPGTQRFTVDRVTVIDAISSAGDLTDDGKREDIMVIREEGGKKIFYTIDLRDKSVFQSPAYILQPNDIIYVGISKNKIKTLNEDPQKERRTNRIISYSSILIGIISFIITIVR